MNDLRLDALPLEILQSVCRSLCEDDEGDGIQGLLSLSRTSKRLRGIAIPDLFKEISPLLPSFESSIGLVPYTAFIPLLRIFITNVDIAAEVRDILIPSGPFGRRHMPADDFQIIYKRASALGVEIPGATYPDACKKSAESDEHSDAANDDGTAEQFLTEMILVHTPNVRTIDYRVRNRTTIFGTLCSASNGMKRKPLFPKLIDFRMENLGSAQRVKPLAEWAPSLDSLWLETAQGPVAGLQFNTVRVLLLTKAQFNDAEMKELIRGFPNVKKFWFTWSINERIPTPSDYNQLLCSPQGVVDALQPLKAQLTELTLRFDDWQGFFCSHIRTEGPVNVVESFKDFEALQRLDIDGATLYDQTRNANESYDAHIARPLDGILPGSLKSLNLMDLRRGPVDDDLLTFASCAGNCCPELQRIDYQRSFRKGGMYRIPPAELSELKNEFGANGVIFESHNDTSHKPVSWRK